MIEVRGLTKRYRRQDALRGMTFHVPPGSIFGFIGQNGAGKTTTIRILATLLKPGDGEARVAGCDVVRRPAEVRRVLGYMPDFFGVYDDLKVTEYLEFYADAHGVRGEAARRLRNDLLELVDLAHKRDAYVNDLSRGMQQRLCLARALIHDPQVLLLDEPASGLDPLARVEMRALLKELQAMGKTILISSHILPELADFCTHIGIVARGQVVRQGTLDEVLSEGERTLRVRVLEGAGGAARVLESQPDVGNLVLLDAHQVEFTYAGGTEGMAGLIESLQGEGLRVASFAEPSSSLEETFLRLTKEAAI